MSDEINPQTETELSDDQLLEAAMKADAGQVVEVSEPAKTEASAAATEPSATEKPETKKEEGKNETDPEPGPETKPTGEQSKYQKEQERRERSWQKLEEEKKALRAEQERLEQQRKEVEATQAKAKVYRDERGYSAEDYEDFAKTTEDPELAIKAKQKALTLRQEAEEKRSSASRDEFLTGWKKNLNEAMEAHPELADETSDLGKALQQTLKERQVYSMAPDGIKHALEFVKAKSQADLVPGLEKKVQELETEISRLNKLTGITPGGPQAQPKAKSFDDMTSAEQDAELERMAVEADRVGAT